MTKFWVSLTSLFLMLVYQAIIGALAMQVNGFTLPPVWVYILSVLGPVVLLAAHAMPSVFNMLPGVTGDVPTPAPEPITTKTIVVPESAVPKA